MVDVALFFIWGRSCCAPMGRKGGKKRARFRCLSTTLIRGWRFTPQHFSIWSPVTATSSHLSRLSPRLSYCWCGLYHIFGHRHSSYISSVSSLSIAFHWRKKIECHAGTLQIQHISCSSALNKYLWFRYALMLLLFQELQFAKVLLSYSTDVNF